MTDPLEKFSNNFKKSLKIATHLAVELSQPQINPQHLLYGLISQRGSVGAELFTAMKIKSDDIKSNITKLHNQELPEPITTTKANPQFSSNAKTVIQKSAQIAYINQHHYIGTEHLLAALLQINYPEIELILKKINLSKKDLTEKVKATLKSASKLPDLTDTFKVIDQEAKQKNDIHGSPVTDILDTFGRDLTNIKTQEAIDPVIGRDNEINRVIQILSRRTKNNPILLGEPGVGKTAIIEGLAKKIMNNEVPKALENKKIYAIDLTTTVAGTMYRGEFENRIKQIIDVVKKQPDIILFIDEIHNIVGAGSASGSMDAANILKPALARGEIRCIGATTFSDFRKNIEGDTALERRFQAVKIAEPGIDETKTILNGVKEYFEKFHEVSITDEAVEAAAELSQKYLPEKFLPDKAIDLVDEAAAAKKVHRQPTTSEKTISQLTKKLSQLNEEKEKAILMENFRQAMTIKEEAKQLKDKLAHLKAKQKNNHDKITEHITAPDIAKTITQMTGIPVSDITTSEKRKFISLHHQLAKEIFGQKPAINLVADYIRRAKAGLTPQHKPLASFMFVGPSGVGKTYTAKRLSQTLFGDSKSLIRIDMSEYSEKFNISKLIGAPAGYVGYKESGQLTEKVKHRPYSIVLFDEIEKANRDIFDLLLQIMDDGYLTDAAGSKINFQNTIVIMTSNVGSQHLKSNKHIGFGGDDKEDQASEQLKEKIIAEAKNHFKPEFIDRLDEMVYFDPLTITDLQKIVKAELAEIEIRLAKQDIKISFEPKLVKLLAQKNCQSAQGARPVKKTIRDLVETPLAQKILSGELKSGDKITISTKNNLVLFKS